jgi:hypothetical protein
MRIRHAQPDFKWVEPGKTLEDTARDPAMVRGVKKTERAAIDGKIPVNSADRTAL